MERTGGVKYVDTTQLQSTRECPNCMSSQINVIDSRADVNGVVKRRKKCISCGHRWNTYEITEEDLKDMLDRQDDIDKANRMVKLKKEITKKATILMSEAKKLNDLAERIR